MFRYPDPLDDHRAWEAELARLEKQVPVCCDHDVPIMEDFYYEIDDERPICAECLEEKHKVKTEGRTLVCDHCGHTITDEHAYKNDDGEVFCKKCVDKHYKKDVVVE